jgi:hypothetical protein
MHAFDGPELYFREVRLSEVKNGQRCPQCPVRDGRPEKGGLSLRANRRHRHLLFDHLVGGREQFRRRGDGFGGAVR